MSEQENIDQVNAIYDAFSRGDVGFIINQPSDDVHWFSHVDKILPTSGDWSGKANVPGFFEAINDAVEVESFPPSSEYVARGDTVVSTGGFGAKVRKNGRSFDSKWVFIWKIADGKVVSYEQFHDTVMSDAYR